MNLSTLKYNHTLLKHNTILCMVKKTQKRTQRYPQMKNICGNTIDCSLKKKKENNIILRILHY